MTNTKINGISYIVSFDPHTKESAQAYMRTEGIQVKDVINVLHGQREELYSSLRLKLPKTKVSVTIAEPVTHSYEHGVRTVATFFGSKYALGYRLPPKPDMYTARHEVGHELQTIRNNRLIEWEDSSIGLPPKEYSLVVNFSDLEKEGFATFLSGSPPHSPKSFPLRDIARVFKQLGMGQQPDFVLKNPWTVRGYANLTDEMKNGYSYFGQIPYVMGQNIFSTIEKAGYDAVNVGLSENPIGMLREYEMSCGRLAIKPLITRKGFFDARKRTR